MLTSVLHKNSICVRMQLCSCMHICLCLWTPPRDFRLPYLLVVPIVNSWLCQCRQRMKTDNLIYISSVISLPIFLPETMSIVVMSLSSGTPRLYIICIRHQAYLTSDMNRNDNKKQFQHHTSVYANKSEGDSKFTIQRTLQRRYRSHTSKCTAATVTQPARYTEHDYCNCLLSPTNLSHSGKMSHSSNNKTASTRHSPLVVSNDIQRNRKT